ncbi:MAG: amidohydrolase [Fretibacterium sp.]|nr:amidohydrolase [Fretibacterium sp.]
MGDFAECLAPEEAKHYIDKVVAWRRDIHRHPELSQQEERTSALVTEVLTGLGLEVRSNVGGYGVVGLLRGKTGGRTVGLRADMDALPLKEETGLPYASESEGVMHACGHDTHTAMLLGTACALADRREKILGNVKFLFQPAEELNPIGGAPGMIAGGALEEPHVDALFALHVWPRFTTGTVAMKPGPQMGASDRLFLTVHGKSAHGSAPDQGIDAVMIASQVVSGLQSIVSRSVSPLDSAVVTIGTIKGGWRYNVIPDRVEMEGTVRTLREGTQALMPELITRTAKGIAESLGGSCEVKYVKGYPPMVNDPALFELAARAVRRAMGPDALVVAEQPELGAEDFAFFARERPSVMGWLGCRPKGARPEDTAVLHNTRFCPDEGCFPYGMSFLASCALGFLNSPAS